MQVQQVNWMCVFIKWFAGSEIPVCTNNRTIGTLHAARKSSGTFSRSQERPFRRPVLKSSASKVADQPRSSTPTIPTALVASRYLWQLRAGKAGGGVSSHGRQTRREKEKGESEEQVPWERVPVLHSTESPPACQWEDSPAAAEAELAAQQRCCRCIITYSRYSPQENSGSDRFF